MPNGFTPQFIEVRITDNGAPVVKRFSGSEGNLSSHLRPLWARSHKLKQMQINCEYKSLCEHTSAKLV